MDVFKMIGGGLGIAFAVFVIWWVVVCGLPSCCSAAATDDVAYRQGPCLDGYIWNQKKDECI